MSYISKTFRFVLLNSIRVNVFTSQVLPVNTDQFFLLELFHRAAD